MVERERLALVVRAVMRTSRRSTYSVMLALNLAVAERGSLQVVPAPAWKRVASHSLDCPTSSQVTHMEHRICQVRSGLTRRASGILARWILTAMDSVILFTPIRILLSSLLRLEPEQA